MATEYPPGAGPNGGEPFEPEGLTLRDYLAVVWRRKWIILLVTVVATAAAWFFADRQPDKFLATTELIYETQIDVANPLSQYGGANATERDTEMRAVGNILVSPEMIHLAEVELAKRYAGDFVRTGVGAESSRGMFDWGADDEAGPVGYAVTAEIPDEAGTTTTTSNVVSIKATSTDSALAAAAANSYAEAFVSYRKTRQREQIAKAISVVRGQVQQYAGAATQSADYLILQQRLRDLQIRYKTASGNFRVLVPAQRPGAPFEPRPLRSAVLGLGVGLFAAIGLAFLLEQFDTRLRRQDEVARILRQPILGRVPRISKRLLGESAMVTLRHPDGLAAESFRMIRTNLEFMSVDADVKSLLVTSCVQGEGKSVTVANLAVTMAMSGKKVVVVDGDLRRPRMHAYFGVDNEIGVSTVTSGKTSLAAALEPIEVAPQNGKVGVDFAEWAKGADARSRLFLLPSGPLPPNPGEMVNSRRFGQMIQALEKEADLVIVDSPAMLAVGDTAALAAKVDGLVFLVDMHILKRPMLMQAVEQLYKLPVKLLGVIVRSDSTGSGGRYYGYYGSPYGYYEYDGRGGGHGGRVGRGGASDARSKRASGSAGSGSSSGASRASASDVGTTS